MRNHYKWVDHTTSTHTLDVTTSIRSNWNYGADLISHSGLDSWPPGKSPRHRNRDLVSPSELKNVFGLFLALLRPLCASPHPSLGRQLGPGEAPGASAFLCLSPLAKAGAIRDCIGLVIAHAAQLPSCVLPLALTSLLFIPHLGVRSHRAYPY